MNPKTDVSKVSGNGENDGCFRIFAQKNDAQNSPFPVARTIASFIEDMGVFFTQDKKWRERKRSHPSTDRYISKNIYDMQLCP